MVENSDLEIWNLHRAARQNRTDIARVLIAGGDDIDAKNNGGDTPLSFAASENSLDVAQLLIEHGAEIDARTHWEWTPVLCSQ